MRITNTITNTYTQVRLPIGNGNKGAWRLAWIEHVHRSTAQGMLHSYDVRMESDGKFYKNIVNDIRVFQDDPHVYKTLDRDLVVHQIAPASFSDTVNQNVLQSQWKPCVIESIRKKKGKTDRDLIVMFMDHTKRTVKETDVRLKTPKSIQQILDSDEEEEEEEKEMDEMEKRKRRNNQELRVGDRVFVKPVQFDMTLRCSFPGCVWHVATPNEKRDPVMWAYMVSRVHAHEMKCHINDSADGTRGRAFADDFETSFLLTIVNGTDITTLKKRVAPSTFVEILFVDRRYRLANGSLRVLRRFCTKVDRDTDSPQWNEQFEVKNITSTALQMQLILWEDTKKSSISTKSKCLGHVTYNLSSSIESKSKRGSSSQDIKGDLGTRNFVPRIGHGSSVLNHSEIISFPWLHTSRISNGKPTGFDSGDSEKNSGGVSKLTFSLNVLV